MEEDEWRRSRAGSDGERRVGLRDAESVVRLDELEELDTVDMVLGDRGRERG